jgi:hypothetical protein
MLSHLDTEYHRSIRREAQRQRRANQDSDSRDLRRKNDSDARRSARDSLQDEDRARIRVADSVAHSSARNTVTIANASNGERWWIRVSMLNSNQNATPLGLKWNRVCKHCGIKVNHNSNRLLVLDCKHRF